AAALEHRVAAVAPLRAHWADALAAVTIGAPLRGARLAAGFADRLLHACGDRALDSDWYAKRAVVAAIARSAELVAVQDRHPELDEARAYVRRAVDAAAAAHDSRASAAHLACVL